MLLGLLLAWYLDLLIPNVVALAVLVGLASLPECRQFVLRLAQRPSRATSIYVVVMYVWLFAELAVIGAGASGALFIWEILALPASLILFLIQEFVGAPGLGELLLLAVPALNGVFLGLALRARQRRGASEPEPSRR